MWCNVKKIRLKARRSLTVACNDKNTDCSPCEDCPEPPEPVLPKCDVTLPDGVFENATVVVEDGCIVKVEQGEPPQYDPELCCDPPDNSADEESEPCDCPPGEDGDSATVSIGSVTSLPAGEPPTVSNSGTDTDAILDFGIPEGEDGQDGGETEGVTDDSGGIVIEDGVIKELPLEWPPITSLSFNADPDGVIASADPPDSDGNVEITIDINGALSDLETDYNQKISDLTQELNDLADRVEENEEDIEEIQEDCCDN